MKIFIAAFICACVLYYILNWSRNKFKNSDNYSDNKSIVYKAISVLYFINGAAITIGFMCLLFILIGYVGEDSNNENDIIEVSYEDTIRIKNATQLIDSLRNSNSRNQDAFTIYDSIQHENFNDSLYNEYSNSQDPPDDSRS